MNISQVSRDVTSGAVTSLVSLVYSLGFAAMIFSGNLSGGMSQGISALLIGTGVTALAAATLSGFRFAVSGPDGNACTVMASMAAAIAGDLALKTAPAVAVVNVLYLLAMTTLIAGLFLAALGLARAGRWIRFIPYPVVGGLIAAAGVLMMLGALRVSIGNAPPQYDAALLAQPAVQGQMLLGLACGALLLAVLRRFRHALALPLTLGAGVIAFHAALALLGVSTDQARAQGWLFAAPEGAALWWPWSVAGFQQTDWLLLASRAGDIATLVLVTTLTLLINATGLEVETRVDANLDRELVIQGGANVLSPLLGGFLGHLSMNRSLINYKLGGTQRISGLVFGVIALALAWSGMGFVALLPRAVLGGLLLYFGSLLVWKWAVATRQQLALPDYLTLLLILCVTVLFGFGHGLVVGVLAGCVMFVVSYSKLRVIKHRFSGSEYRSSHERSSEDKAILTRHGGELRIFVLQGFIFFGMADRLYRSILESAFPRGGEQARQIVIDLGQVHGVDASAVASFKKISYSTRSAGAHLILTGMAADMLAEWQASGDADLLAINHFANLDAGVEHCENQLILRHSRTPKSAEEVMHDWLHAEIGAGANILLGFMSRRNLAAGQVLCRQHEAADGMYFIESGRVAVELALPDGGRRRLRTLGPKTVLGEMGLYRSGTRSADVLAQEDCVVYEFSDASMRAVEAREPAVAARFHAMVVRTVADRLEFSNALVAALQR